MSIFIKHTRTTWSHDYEVTREGMSMGTYRIILSKAENRSYFYTIIHGGERILKGDTKFGRRPDAVRFAKDALFRHVRYGNYR